MKRLSIVSLSVIAILLLGAGAFLALPNLVGSSSAKPKPAATIATVIREPDIVALGEVVPRTDILIIAGPTGQDGGRIAEITVAEGDQVASGAILATLDTLAGLDADLNHAMAALDQSRADLARTMADAKSNEGSLAAQLGQQRAERELADWSLEQATQLKEQGLYEEAYLTDKRLNVASAEARLQSTEVSLQRAREKDANGQPLDVAVALASVKAAEAAVVKAQADREKAFVRAPIAGRILTLRGRLGQEISSDGFADIADTATMMVRAEVFETDVHRLHVGMPSVSRSRVLETSLSGTIERIAIRLSQQSIISTDPAAVVDARVVEVWVRLDADSSRQIANLSGLQVNVNFGPGDDEDA